MWYQEETNKHTHKEREEEKEKKREREREREKERERGKGEGKREGEGEGEVGVGSLPAQAAQRHRLLTDVMRLCASLLRDLKETHAAYPFLKPVTPDHFTGTPSERRKQHSQYLDFIGHKPMDLGTVSDKVTRGMYTSPVLFRDDVRQCFINCFVLIKDKQRAKHLAIYRSAEETSLEFESRWKESQIQRMWEAGLADIGAGAPFPLSSDRNKGKGEREANGKRQGKGEEGKEAGKGKHGMGGKEGKEGRGPGGPLGCVRLDPTWRRQLDGIKRACGKTYLVMSHSPYHADYYTSLYHEALRTLPKEEIERHSKELYTVLWLPKEYVDEKARTHTHTRTRTHTHMHTRTHACTQTRPRTCFPSLAFPPLAFPLFFPSVRLHSLTRMHRARASLYLSFPCFPLPCFPPFLFFPLFRSLFSLLFSLRYEEIRERVWAHVHLGYGEIMYRQKCVAGGFGKREQAEEKFLFLLREYQVR